MLPPLSMKKHRVTDELKQMLRGSACGRKGSKRLVVSCQMRDT